MGVRGLERCCSARSRYTKDIQGSHVGTSQSEWLARQERSRDSRLDGHLEVFNRADLPDGANVITVKWVLKRKHDASGQATEFKARMTPHGYKQIEGVDFYETYAQVGMYKTLVSADLDSTLRFGVRSAGRTICFSEC